MTEHLSSKALLPAPERVQIVQPHPIRCCVCPSREARYWTTLGDIALPLRALWQRPCPRCSEWLLNENGVVLAGVVVFKGRYATVRMRG